VETEVHVPGIETQTRDPLSNLIATTPRQNTLQALVVVVGTEYTGRVSEWFIFNAKGPNFQLYHGEMVQVDVYCFMLK
jgi:hypothetical protein